MDLTCEKNDPRHRSHHEYRDAKSVGSLLDFTDHHERQWINGTIRPWFQRARDIGHGSVLRLRGDPAVRERYERKYQETAGLYYAGLMPFAAILARIAEHIDRL